MSLPLAMVTGAAGFIGRYCGREMAARGYAVLGLDRVALANASDWGFSCWHSGAISSEVLEEIFAKSARPEVIIHCAGSGSVADSFADPKGDFAANVSTTLDMLEIARVFECKAFVLPSSAAVYGQTWEVPIKESTSLLPVSPYGSHKRMAELLCTSYGTAFGVPTICVRLFSVYGRGLRKQLLWDACQKAFAGKYEFFGSGDESRDWIHVSDAARLLALATEHALPSCPIVNGGCGKGTQIKSILVALGQLWKPQLTPIFSGSVRKGDPTNYIADVSRIAEWGFVPRADMTAELVKYVEWFKTIIA